jgi:hypothetical protein
MTRNSFLIDKRINIKSRMKQSLIALMNGVIDYAGLFPPAKLDLDTAIRNYAKYQQGDNAQMLSQFIIPASRLEELSPYAGELFSPERPFSFSVLGRETETTDHYHAAIDEVITACESFNAAHPNSVHTDMLEMKLPKEAAFSHDSELLKQIMDDTARKLSASAAAPATIFYEGFLDQSWKKDVEAILKAVALHNENAPSQNYATAAFKIRCGGVEAGQFPETGQVGFIINRAREHNVPWKGTAGLHHPVRHYSESVQTKMHGFFNVLGGAMLGYAHDLNDKELNEILNEEDSGQFKFTDEVFSWQDYSISTAKIKELREVAILSYGSCSFDDPREDLEKLGLM